jgi:hypothetical protein
MTRSPEDVCHMWTKGQTTTPTPPKKEGLYCAEESVVRAEEIGSRRPRTRQADLVTPPSPSLFSHRTPLLPGTRQPILSLSENIPV